VPDIADNQIKTKSQRNIKRLNAIVFFAVSAVVLALGVMLAQVTLNGFQYQPGVQDTAEYKQLAGMVTLISAEMYLLLFLPAAAIFFSIQSGRKRGIRANASFTAFEGITYYRDFLKDITPADMSIIADLNIEGKKDISATLLRLYNKKIITFEANRVVLADGGAALSPDEGELVNMFKNGGITKSGVAAWKNNRLREAEAKGFIDAPPGNKIVKVLTGCLSSCCLSVVLFFVFAFVAGFLGANVIDDLEASSADLDYFATAVLTQSEVALFTEILTQYAILVLFIVFFVLILCFTGFWIFGYAMTKSHFIKTPKGNEIAEKIAGLQNFIHDFSVLSERQKEEVFLWDDFLVYAVVLEENEDIVKDISKAFKVDLSGVYSAILNL